MTPKPVRDQATAAEQPVRHPSGAGMTAASRLLAPKPVDAAPAPDAPADGGPR